ncbi:MAG: alkaline phosphatase [Spirochaetes bacterium]|nr:alkaline phosphatase [Spirochaetota bacterium]
MNKNKWKILRASVLTIALHAAFLTCKNPKSTADFHLFWQGNGYTHKIFNDTIAPLTHAVWSTSHHTSTATVVGSIGPSHYQRALAGFIQNTDVARTMQKAIAEGVSIILVIGDGFGVSHLSLHHFATIATKEKRTNSFDVILKNGTLGLCHTYTHSQLVTDSAAAATALACGVKTTVGTIGIGPNGEKLESVLKKAQKKGFKTGIITDTNITDATPAGFYGQVKSRDEENVLAEQLATAQIDVVLGGGASHFIPQRTTASQHALLKGIAIDGQSKRTDDFDLISAMHKRGYLVIVNKKMLHNNYKKAQKLFGLFSAGTMNSRIDRDDENTGEPSIPEMANAALHILSKNKKRFFLVIECGKLDYDSHDNDVGATIAALREMEEVLALCLNYYQKNSSQTLLVFTGDHETGAPAFSYYEIRENADATKNASGYSFPPIDQLKYYFHQKQSLRKILFESKSPEELQKKLNENFPKKFSREDVEKIFQTLH